MKQWSKNVVYKREEIMDERNRSKLRKNERKKEKLKKKIKKCNKHWDENVRVGWLVGWLFCFTAYQFFLGYLTPNFHIHWNLTIWLFKQFSLA